MSGTLAEFPSWEGSGVGRFIESPSMAVNQLPRSPAVFIAIRRGLPASGFIWPTRAWRWKS